jgi:hypothetical protein
MRKVGYPASEIFSKKIDKEEDLMPSTHVKSFQIDINLNYSIGLGTISTLPFLPPAQARVTASSI